MLKKIVTFLLSLTLVLSTAACNIQSSIDTQTTTSNKETEPVISLKIPEQKTLETLEADVIKDVENSIAMLRNEKEILANEIDSFDKYKDNEDRIKAFYENICMETLTLGISLMEYAVVYAEFIMESDSDFDDKYDDLDELYDVICEDAKDEIYDEIYDGVLDEMYDLFYDGLLDDAYDSVPYEKWFDACSNEYERWFDASLECYEIWLDTHSDIYEFWLDMRSATFNKDAEEAFEVISDFKEDIEKFKQ